jgi:hypothetical protein
MSEHFHCRCEALCKEALQLRFGDPNRALDPEDANFSCPDDPSASSLTNPESQSKGGHIKEMLRAEGERTVGHRADSRFRHDSSASRGMRYTRPIFRAGSSPRRIAARTVLYATPAWAANVTGEMKGLAMMWRLCMAVRLNPYP